MTRNQSTYTLHLDAEISKLTSKTNQVKEVLTKIGAVGKFPELDKGLETVFKKLDKIKEAAAAPISSSTFKNLEKDASAIGVHLSKLSQIISELSQNTSGAALNILPPELQSRLKEAQGAISKYELSIEKASQRTKELTDAENALANSTNKLSSWQNKLADAENARNQAQDTLAANKAEKKAIDERIAASKTEIAERKKDIAELEKLYEKQGLDKRKNIVDQDGKTRNLIREKISVSKTEKDLSVDENLSQDLQQQILNGEKAVKTYSDRIVECTTNIGNWEAAIVRCTEKLRELEDAFNNSRVQQTQQAYTDLRKEAERLGIDLSDLPLEGTSENMEVLKNRVAAVEQEMSDLATSTLQEAQTAFQGTENTIGEFCDAIDKAKESSDQFNEAKKRASDLKNSIKQFVGWAGAAKVLSAALRNAFRDIKELDSAMTEIAVVTSFSIDDMWGQLPEYTRRANDLGLSIAEVYEASALFYQQGLRTNEMVEISNETLKMAKIAGLSAADATDRMTAALRGFNMELNETSAQNVADVYSELAAITASDVDEISKAMTKTASIASSAGMEFETTAAFLSQIIETTRESAETAGTAMKTVIARFQELKKAPEDIEEVDGEKIDANGIERALRSVGVSLRDASGQFRELDEVFLELSSKWNTLDKNTQRYIATIAAGSRQQSRFIAMMQDYERTQELVAAANNSSGASAKQYEKTLESLQTKLTKLDNAWTEFSTGLMNSDFVKRAVEFLTSLLNGLNKATEGFGSFTSSVSKIGTLVAIFQTAKTLVSKFFDDIVQKVYLSAHSAGEKIATGVNEGIQSKTFSSVVGISSIAEGYNMISANSQDFKKAKQRLRQLETKKLYAGIRQHEARRSGDQNKISKANEDYAKTIAQIEQETEQLKGTIKKTWDGIDKMAAGANSAAAALTLMGSAVAMVGQKFAETGYSEIAETIQAIGSGITMTGSTLMALIPIITIVAKQIEDKGKKAMASWLAFIAVITAVIVALSIVDATIKKKSPEQKLEKLADSADKAGAAAERAEKAYDKLSETLGNLEKDYSSLQKLTKGTEEWKDAVQDLNDQVLELVNQFPGLAAFVENQSGVLKLDINQSGVQEILKEAKSNVAISRNNAQLADIAMINGQNAVGYRNLEDDAKLKQGHGAYGSTLAGSILTMGGAGALGGLAIGGGWGALAGGIGGGILGLIKGFGYAREAKYAVQENNRSTVEALAKAIAAGDIIANKEAGTFDVKDEEALKERGIDINKLGEYYDTIGDSTESLRSFGLELLATEKQTRVAFGAVAANAVALANTLGFTDQQKEQASNIVDETTSSKLYEKKLAELGSQDFTKENGSNAMSDSQKAERDKAIKAQYGQGARIEGSTVYYRNESGDQVAENLSSDEIKQLIAGHYATEESIRLAELTPTITKNTVDQIAQQMGQGDDATKAALNKLLADDTGGNMTQGELELLGKMNEESLRTLYGSLTADAQTVFGTVDNFLAKTVKARNSGNFAFMEAQAIAQDLGIDLDKNFSAKVQSGYTKKLTEVFGRNTGDVGVVQEIDELYDQFISKSKDKQEEVAALINGVDWTNQEALIGLQYELAASYGYSLDEAKEFVRSLGEAAKATSGLVTVLDQFGKYFKATQQLEQALNKVEDAEWEYQRALNENDTEKMMEKRGEIQDALLDSINEASNAAKEANYRTAQKYASGKMVLQSYDLTTRVTYDEEKGTFDFSEFNEFIKTLGQEDQEKAVEWANGLVEQSKIARDQLKVAKDSYEKLEQMQQESKEAYESMENRVAELLIKERQDAIDLQKDILEATKSTGEKIFDGIQRQIDQSRQNRENDKTEQELSKLRNQIGLLSMDSSGANALEILDLQQQLSEAEQNYQDSLIDQTLQNLQDANDQAYEQRERQIYIMEQQLDSYKISKNFQQDIQNILTEYYQSYQDAQDRGIHFDPQDTVLGQRMLSSMREGMNEAEISETMDQIGVDTAVSSDWYQTNKLGDVTAEGSMEKALEKIKDGLALEKDTIDDLGDAISTVIQATQTEFTVGARNAATRATTPLGLFNYVTASPSAQTAIQKIGEGYKNGENSGYEGFYKDMATRVDLLTPPNDTTATKAHTVYTNLNDDQKKAVNSDLGLPNGIPSRDAYYSNLTEKEWTNLFHEVAKNGNQAESLWENKFDDPSWAIKIAKHIATPIPYLASNWTNNKVQFATSSDEKMTGTIYNWTEKAKAVHAGVGADVAERLNFALEAYQNKGVEHSHAMYDGTTIYIKNDDGNWRSLSSTGTQKQKDKYAKVMATAKTYAEWLRGRFKTGGLADFTGPAWLDGTKSKPEYVLNAKQTERFFTLVDVLEHYKPTETEKKASGDNYFDINISVEKVDNDYDVEKIADKIRRMIYEDAIYRNVHSINRLR